MARDTTLIPVLRQTLNGVRPESLYSYLHNGQLPAFLIRRTKGYIILLFRSRLREDFRPFPLTRLTLLPGSLPAVWAYSFPLSPFHDGLNYNSKTFLPQG